MVVSPPAEVTACCWDPNSPGMLGLCGADGSLVLAKHDAEQGVYVQQYTSIPIYCTVLLYPHRDVT